MKLVDLIKEKNKVAKVSHDIYKINKEIEESLGNQKVFFKILYIKKNTIFISVNNSSEAFFIQNIFDKKKNQEIFNKLKKIKFLFN